MNAEVISVGEELLAGETLDTNAATLGRALLECGVSCRHRQTVGDDITAISRAITLALNRSQFVFLIGGLGPTPDDLTRDGLAMALGLPLEPDPEMLATIKAMFETRGLRWVESNSLQANRPRGATFLANRFGTAPGLYCLWKGVHLFALPGPPREFDPMLNDEILPLIRSLTGTQVLHSKTLRICGLGESRVAEIVADLLTPSYPSVAPYAKFADVHLRITSAKASLAEAEQEIASIDEEIRKRLGWHVYGVDQQTLAEVVLSQLKLQGKSLSTAESCTGGQLASLITDIPGASEVFRGAAVTYTNAMKVKFLEVSPETLAEHGAVSEAVAREMASGAKRAFGTDYSISVTGVAGPGPDDRGNAEGTVILGIGSPSGEQVQTLNLGKGRIDIKMRASITGLTQLWKHLVEGDSG